VKTSDGETAALERYLRRSIETPVPYFVGVNDCLDFCVRGLWSAGIPAPIPSVVLGGAFPTRYFDSWLLEMAIRMWERQDRAVPTVETSYCVHGVDCQ
jgi:hypothetical protein